MGYRNYSTGNSFIVDKLGNGDFKTIATALTAAVSGDTIFIRPGTYTENPTLKAGVNLCAFGPYQPIYISTIVPNVIINGKCTFTAAGTVGLYGICLQTNSDFALAVTGSAASIVILNDCYIYALNNTAISYSSSSGSSEVVLSNCGGDIATTGIAVYANSAAGFLRMNYCDFENDGLSVTANTVSGTGGITMEYSTISNGITFSGTSDGLCQYCRYNMATDQIAITNNSTAANIGFSYCYFACITASAISIGVGATVAAHYCFLSSSNANTITGTGTLQFTNLTCNSVANLDAGLTLVLNAMHTFVGAGGIGTAGQVLTSNGSSAPPTFQGTSSFAWTDEGTSFNALASNGYFITAVATATLPASPSQGNMISFIVDTASALTLRANTGQVIRIGAAVSASAGSAVSNARGDSVTLVYRSSDTAWIETSVVGTWTVT